MDQFWYNRRMSMAGKPGRVEVFDTTLRDGEQTPGVNLSGREKLEIAWALNDLGVDYIEAGFPVSSPGELEAVKSVSQAGLKSSVVGLARCVEKDIDAAANAEVDMIHVFIGTSPVHRRHKLKLDKSQVLERMQESIQYAFDAGFKVHFSPEDACRTELDFLKEVCKIAEGMGVEHINIPDTVGVMTPAAMAYLMGELKATVDTPLAVHCHNDFGMAVANTVAAITAGASIPHVTINGLGERAGNADLAQTVMSVKLIHEVESNIVCERIWETSKLVERKTNVRVMPNFPIVGDNAFAHESGVHVHGVLAEASTYEAINPEMVGAKRKLVLGKLVGKHGVKDKLEGMGFKVDSVQAQAITEKVKSLADKGKKVAEEDLMAIAEDMLGSISEKEQSVKLVDMQLNMNYGGKPRSSVKLVVDGIQKEAESEGVGPVDAALTAIRHAIGDEEITLEEYHLDAITGGSDALADVSVRVGKNSDTTLARGVHEDVVMASVTAFINGVNRIKKQVD